MTSRSWATIFFNHDPLVYLSYLCAPAMWWLLYRSRWGLTVRGAGERPEVLATYGHSPLLVRYLAVVGGGMLAGIGGAQLVDRVRQRLVREHDRRGGASSPWRW